MSRRRLSAALLACLAVPAAVIAGCGGGGGGSTDVGPAADVPANAPIYIDATVRPTGSAQADAKAALSKILGTSDPGGKIVSLIEQSSKSDGHPVDYQQDIAPWLGEKAGAYFTNLSAATTEGAAIVETTNPAAALAFARKASGATATNPAPQTYNGVSYQTDPTDSTSVFGTVGDFLVEGTLTGFKGVVDASKGDSLGDSSDFKDAIGELPGDRLGTFYTVPKTLLDSIGPGQIDAQSQALLEKSAGDQLDKPVAGALSATSDSLDLDFIGGKSVETPESSLFGDVPSQAWLALGIANLGDVVKQQIDQFKDQIPNFDATVQQIQATTGSSLEELEGSLGDAVLYVQGTSMKSLGGALIVKSEKPDLTSRLLGQLSSLLQLGAPKGAIKPLQLGAGGTGFEMSDPSVAPQPIDIGQQGDEIVIGYGAGSAAQALSPASKLSDSPTFTAAQGRVSSLGTDFFLDFPSVFALAESQGAKSDPGYLQAKPYLDALSYLVSGSGSHGDQAEVKAVLGLK